MREIEIRHRRGLCSVPVHCDGEDDASQAAFVADGAMLRARLDQALQGVGHSVALLSLDWELPKHESESFDADTTRRLGRELARRLREHAGPGDCLAQTEETRFELLLSHLDVEGSAERIAGALVHDLSRPLVLDALELRGHVSVGVAVSGLHGQDAARLWAAAETAREEASALGGDAYLIAR